MEGLQRPHNRILLKRSQQKPTLYARRKRWRDRGHFGTLFRTDLLEPLRAQAQALP